MNNRELKERINELTDAGEILRARFRRIASKWGFYDADLDELTSEWDAVTESIDREGRDAK